MLTPDNASPDSFAILFENGALQVKTAPHASASTLLLVARCVSRQEMRLAVKAADSALPKHQKGCIALSPEESGVRFSEGSWEYSYKSTFRVFVELVGELRRDRANADGSTACGVLDIGARNFC